MLVLSRRLQESIVFPALDITVRVVKIDGRIVRLGVEAPSDVKVLRGELASALPAHSAAPSTMSHALRNRLNKIGLGLHLAQRLLQAGRAAEAEPVLRQALEQLDATERDAAPKPPPPRLRTLIVEDDTNERELLAGLLNLTGCDCAVAADGVAALEYLEAHDRPDVVLLDMHMPRCDGPSTVAAIRQSPRLAGLKVFAVSGTAPTDLGVRTGPDGVDAWFPKPLDPRRLWEALRSQ